MLEVILCPAYVDLRPVYVWRLFYVMSNESKACLKCLMSCRRPSIIFCYWSVFSWLGVELKVKHQSDKPRSDQCCRIRVEYIAPASEIIYYVRTTIAWSLPWLVQGVPVSTKRKLFMQSVLHLSALGPRCLLASLYACLQYRPRFFLSHPPPPPPFALSSFSSFF